MTTLTIHIDNKKSEKAIKAVLEALNVSYEEQPNKPIEYAQHIIDGVAFAKEDISEGRVKDYKGLNSILGR